MRVLEGVLKEGYRRLQHLEQRYFRELKKLPMGSIQMKKIKGKSYPYHVWSVRSKIHYAYLGKLSPSALKKLKHALQQRKHYQRELKNVQRNLIHMRRLLREK